MIIAFRGLIGSGKSTIAKKLLELNSINDVNLNAKIESFASPIKKALKEIGVFKEKDLPLYRTLAQKMGEECRRYDQDWWVKLLLERIKDYSGTIIIDDLRYGNEYAFIKKNGGIIIHLIREKENSEVLKKKHPELNHESEYFNLLNHTNNLDSYGKTIFNDKPLEETLNTVIEYIAMTKRFREFTLMNRKYE